MRIKLLVMTFLLLFPANLFAAATPKDGTFALLAATKQTEPPPRRLTINEQEPFQVPSDLVRCPVFSKAELSRRVAEANRGGKCEWIVLRPSTDLDQGEPFWLQLDTPLVIENRNPAAATHPLVISNETSRSIVFRQPKNGGCAVIIRKPDVAILGFTMEGAICREADPVPKQEGHK